MGQCRGCGRYMRYKEFEDHLQRSPRCRRIVERLRIKQKKEKEEKLKKEAKK